MRERRLGYRANSNYSYSVYIQLHGVCTASSNNTNFRPVGNQIWISFYKRFVLIVSRDFEMSMSAFSALDASLREVSV